MKYPRSTPTQAQIEANEQKVKKALLDAQIEARGWNYCQECGRSGFKFQLSHNKHKGAGGSKKMITVDDAQILCDTCHKNVKHGLRIKESQPMWTKKGVKQ